MAKKSYTAEQAEEIYERGCREVTSDDWYKNMWAIDEIIRREVKAMMRYGGGLLTPEDRLISYTQIAMKELNMEMNDLNIFMAANSMQNYVMTNLAGIPFPGCPDYDLYKSFKGAAYIMNKIADID